METAVSAIAAILTTVAFIPQAYKIIQPPGFRCVTSYRRFLLVRFRCSALELADDDRKRRNVHADTRHCRHEALSQVRHR